ncbi:MAG: hypothetical protein JXQ90_09750 [Cyclobacteriaceae bacterium]
MRSKFLLGLVVCLNIWACGSEPDLSVLSTLRGEGGLSYVESKSKWSELKNQNGNSYTYQTTFQSWVGFGHTTEIKVKDGVVVARSYQEFSIDQRTGKRTVTDTYQEEGSELGIHEIGAELLTIDELYTACSTSFLIVNQEDNTLYFETADNGLMTTCGYVPNGCVDDCYRGIRINAFEWDE